MVAANPKKAKCTWISLNLYGCYGFRSHLVLIGTIAIKTMFAKMALI